MCEVFLALLAHEKFDMTIVIIAYYPDQTTPFKDWMFSVFWTCVTSKWYMAGFQ